MLPDSDVQAVISEIEAAFAGLEPPGDDNLLHPQCMDDVDIVDFHGEPTWDDLSDEAMIRSWAAHYFFSARAFQYYMPAFMIWSLLHCDTIDYTPESTIRALDPGDVGDPLRAFQVSKFELFTDAQIRSTVSFLRLFSQDAGLGPVADRALASFRDALAIPT
jgi:hypothetical protein